MTVSFCLFKFEFDVERGADISRLRVKILNEVELLVINNSD